MRLHGNEVLIDRPMIDRSQHLIDRSRGGGILCVPETVLFLYWGNINAKVSITLFGSRQVCSACDGNRRPRQRMCLVGNQLDPFEINNWQTGYPVQNSYQNFSLGCWKSVFQSLLLWDIYFLFHFCIVYCWISCVKSLKRIVKSNLLNI